MEFSSSPAVTFANLRHTTADAMEHLRRLRHLTCPESRAFHMAKLARLERAAQALEEDLNVGAMPTSVWFDLPPNEWGEAN